MVLVPRQMLVRTLNQLSYRRKSRQFDARKERQRIESSDMLPLPNLTMAASRDTFQPHLVEGPSQGIEWSPMNWLQYPKEEKQAFVRLNDGLGELWNWLCDRFHCRICMLCRWFSGTTQCSVEVIVPLLGVQ